jgi:hypothetical protein
MTRVLTVEISKPSQSMWVADQSKLKEHKEKEESFKISSVMTGTVLL